MLLSCVAKQLARFLTDVGQLHLANHEVLPFVQERHLKTSTALHLSRQSSPTQPSLAKTAKQNWSGKYDPCDLLLTDQQA